MTTGLYLRISTGKQETENQAIQLRKFAASQGWEIVAEFCDEAISGAKGEKDLQHSARCSRLRPGANSMCSCSGASTG
jgi:DNA invertase Pin-like site-specific DNA recombinase